MKREDFTVIKGKGRKTEDGEKMVERAEMALVLLFIGIASLELGYILAFLLDFYL